MTEKKKGRPRKKDAAVVRIAEAMGVTLAGDAMTIEEMDGFPQLQDESRRVQAIMCMVACGFPQTHIAEAFGVSQPTIWEIIQRVDPDGRFKLSKNAKKAFITQMAEGRAMSAINAISLEDLNKSSAVEKARVADTLMKVSQTMNQSKHREISGNKLDRLMQAIEDDSVEISEAPYDGND